jgi:ribose transport system substrate-binding protein
MEETRMREAWLRRLVLRPFCAAFLVVCSGCSEEEEAQKDETFRIALLTKATTNPFFQEMEEGARRAARELGVVLLSLGVALERAVEDQNAQIARVAREGVDAIVVAPAHSVRVVPALAKAQQKGIVVVNVDTRLDPEAVKEAGLRVAAYVGADNERGAFMVTRHLIRALREKKPGKREYKISMLEGGRGVSNAEIRKQGFYRAAAAAPDVSTVEPRTAKWDTMRAADVFVEMLQDHPDLDGLFCANDMMALGVIRAIQEQNKEGEVLVASYDNLDAAQAEMRRGNLEATLEQHPEKMGELAVRHAVKALRGESVPAETLVDLQLVTLQSLDRN